MWLTFDQLACGYGRTPVLAGVSLRLGPGLWLLTGANGSGKSTLLRCAAGLLPPLAGRLLWNGEDAARLGAAYRYHLGYAPQETGGYPDTDVRGYLTYLAALKAIRPGAVAARVEQVLAQTGLTAFSRRPAALLSGGMQSRLGLAAALLNDPDVLLLDEPAVGLDPEEQIRFRQLLLDLSADRIVLLATNLPEAVDLMAGGTVRLAGGRAHFMEE